MTLNFSSSLSSFDWFKAVPIRRQRLVQQGVEQALLGIAPGNENGGIPPVPGDGTGTDAITDWLNSRIEPTSDKPNIYTCQCLLVPLFASALVALGATAIDNVAYFYWYYPSNLVARV